jgi:hypothetical protein
MNVGEKTPTQMAPKGRRTPAVIGRTARIGILLLHTLFQMRLRSLVRIVRQCRRVFPRGAVNPIRPYGADGVSRRWQLLVRFHSMCLQLVNFPMDSAQLIFIVQECEELYNFASLNVVSPCSGVLKTLYESCTKVFKKT